MTKWRPNPDQITRPAYKSLIAAIVRAVEEGQLRDGERLPTHRQMAFDLGLSVQTVSRAYEELTRRGVILGTVGRGTFISARNVEKHTPYLPERQHGGIIDCSILKPVSQSMHLEIMSRTLHEVAAALPTDVVTAFRPGAAMQKYMHSAREWLATCGLQPLGHPPLLTNSATAAMTVAIMTAADPGDLIVAETLTHHTLKPLADYLGLKVRPVETDRHGMLPDAFRLLCQRQSVKAAYLMPSGLNPLAITMPRKRREELIAVAREFNVLLIENDAWGPLQSDRPAPLAALAPEQTLYFTGFSKCLMPGLRIGMLVAPAALASAASNRHLVSNWMATPLMAEIASRWIEDGTANDLLLWQRGELKKRNIIAAEVLRDVPYGASPSGMHLWLPLPKQWHEADFVAHAQTLGVATAPGRTFAIDGGNVPAGIRVCIGSPNEADLREALSVLSRLVRSRSEPALLGS